MNTAALLIMQGARPHFLVLMAPPNAQLLLMAYDPASPTSLAVTSSINLIPPVPTLRRAEFFTGVIAQDGVALVSLWTGVLSCIEMELEKDNHKDKEGKRRRSSAAANVAAGDEAERRIVFKDNYNIK